MAHEAKFKSEAHPGVGEATDMKIIKRGRCINIQDDLVQKLREAQKEVDRAPLPDVGEANVELVLSIAENEGDIA